MRTQSVRTTHKSIDSSESARISGVVNGQHQGQKQWHCCFRSPVEKGFGVEEAWF